MADEDKSSVKGIVLAGGEGKRLRPLSYYLQKCMIPIGPKQKPLLEYIVRLFRYHGITDVSMLVGYKHEQIVNYFNSGERFAVKISYALDNPSLKGTGGSLLNAYRSGVIKSNENILIYYGDIISGINLTEMIKQHCDSKAMATLALSTGYQVSVGVAEVSEGKLIDWAEKPTLGLNVGIGILMLNGSVLRELEQLSLDHSEFDIMSHLIPHLIKKNAVQAYFTNAFWDDVGSAERYEKLENGIIEKHFEYLFAENPVKPVSMQLYY